MATIYGIDTGSWRLRVAALEGSFGRFALRDVQQVEIPPGADGAPDPAAALAAMQSAEPGWAGGDQIAALPLDVSAVRLVTLPFVDQRAIDRALPAEVEAQVPYDLADMLLVARRIDAREGQSRSLVLTASREDVRARLDALRAGGVDPEALPVDATALAAYADRGVQAVVDVGHARTLVALCQDGQLLAARLLPEGGRAITEAIAVAAGVPAAEAEALKHALALPARGGEVAAEWADERTETRPGGPAEPDRAALAARDAADDWAMDVRAELIALEDTLGLGVDELLFCGGGARLRGLPEVLMARTGLPGRPVTVPGGYPPECALAVALARIGAREVKAPDLRVDEFAHHGEADTLWNVVGATAIGAVLTLVLGGAVFGWRYWDATQRFDAVEAEVVQTVTATFPDIDPATLGSAQSALMAMSGRVAETNARVEALGATVGGEPPTLGLLKLLSEKAPPHAQARIDVKELTIGEQSIALRAETDSYESAARIEEALRREPRFKEARKSDEKKTGDALGFNLTIPLASETSAEEDG